MLKLITCFQKGKATGDYPKALLANLLYLKWLKQVNHPVWHMLEADPSLFNEETGEISFSILSRSTRSNSNRVDLKTANKNYQLSKPIMDIIKDLNADVNDDEDFMMNLNGLVFKDGDENVQTAISFFEGAK